MPVTITYDNTSILNNMDNLAMGVNTMLTTYRRDELIESLIVFTIIRNIVLNETMLECSISGVDSEGAISDLDSEAIKLFVSSSSKSLCHVVDPLPFISGRGKGSGVKYEFLQCFL